MIFYIDKYFKILTPSGFRVVRENKRERESVCVCVREREREKYLWRQMVYFGTLLLSVSRSNDWLKCRREHVDGKRRSSCSHQMSSSCSFSRIPFSNSVDKVEIKRLVARPCVPATAAIVAAAVAGTIAAVRVAAVNGKPAAAAAAGVGGIISKAVAAAAAGCAAATVASCCGGGHKTGAAAVAEASCGGA